MSAVTPPARGFPTPPPRREGPLQMLRTRGQPSRGIALSQVGAGGQPPPSALGAVSAAQRLAAARLAASPFDSHPGAQGTAANPPRGRHVDVRV